MGVRYFGASVSRREDPRLLRGQGRYVDDIKLPGMLHATIVRSPHAHARILSIDTSEAEAHPGVKAVVTASDLPDVESKIADLGEGTINLRHQSNNILAKDKVLYFGHAIAAVAATLTATSRIIRLAPVVTRPTSKSEVQAIETISVRRWSRW